MIREKGCLYVVATPIGHLADMSFRALDILKAVDWIAAEDTRHTQVLFRHYQLNKRCLSLHKFNESRQIEQLIAKLQEGDTGAITSDAGTPGICDPGQRLVMAAHQAGITVIPVPGPCALITALSASGFQSTEFYFSGFLPAKTQACQQKLTQLSQLDCAIVFYEAPHRILSTLTYCQEIFSPSCSILVARELTKAYETLYVNRLGHLFDKPYPDVIKAKGEFVVAIDNGNREDDKPSDGSLDQHSLEVLSMLMTELPLKQSVALTHKLTNAPKKQIYQTALAMKAQVILSD